MDEPESFHRLVAGLDDAMWIVTAAAGTERSGCLVGFATQCSIDPARFLVGISRANHTFPVAERAERLVVHLLRAGDHQLARLFGEVTGDEADKFARCGWTPGPDGAPVLDGLDWFVGRVVARLDLGDHVGHVVEPTTGTVRRPSVPPLGFQAVRDLEPGHDA